eukprot:GFYU01005564.1.p1 GENE.GFYU01005564.1~~GFYU01005564.1.p1  ORF type:complete len:539 (-),score=76.17 GFYU01005564.1:296-1912(-)
MGDNGVTATPTTPQDTTVTRTDAALIRRPESRTAQPPRRLAQRLSQRAASASGMKRPASRGQLDINGKRDSASGLSSTQYQHCSRHPQLWVAYTCVKCQQSLCLRCAHPHFDKHHEIVGGVLKQGEVEIPADVNIQELNDGGECLLDMQRLLCPCGKPFLGNPKSAICCVCGTATCSDECHKTYRQDTGHCLYYRNFKSKDKNGCRCIKLRDIVQTKYGEHLIQCGARYLEADVGRQKSTLVLRRGYCQYGQPHPATLDAIESHKTQEESKNKHRRCTCTCKQCMEQVHHPIHDCPTRYTQPPPPSPPVSTTCVHSPGDDAVARHQQSELLYATAVASKQNCVLDRALALATRLRHVDERLRLSHHTLHVDHTTNHTATQHEPHKGKSTSAHVWHHSHSHPHSHTPRTQPVPVQLQLKVEPLYVGKGDDVLWDVEAQSTSDTSEENTLDIEYLPQYDPTRTDTDRSGTTNVTCNSQCSETSDTVTTTQPPPPPPHNHPKQHARDTGGAVRPLTRAPQCLHHHHHLSQDITHHHIHHCI